MLSRFIYSKSVLAFFLVMGIVLLSLVNFLEASLNQQYVLKQFQIIFENKEFVGTEPGVYEIPGTEFVVGVEHPEELENGINFTEEDFTIYINGYGEKVTYDEIDAKSIDDVYTNYLVYRYSSYMTPILIFFIFIDSLLVYIVLFGVLYLTIRICEYMLFRDGITQGYSYFQRSVKFKYCIVATFVSVFFYSYGSLVIENYFFVKGLPILIGIALIIVQLKTHKRRLKS